MVVTEPGEVRGKKDSQVLMAIGGEQLWITKTVVTGHGGDSPVDEVKNAAFGGVEGEVVVMRPTRDYASYNPCPPPNRPGFFPNLFVAPPSCYLSTLAVTFIGCFIPVADQTSWYLCICPLFAGPLLRLHSNRGPGAFCLSLCATRARRLIH